MTDPLATTDTRAFGGGADKEAGVAFEDALAREQLKDGAHEISDAAADVVGSVRAATLDSFSDIAEAARELIRERPLVAIAAAAGVAYLVARIAR